MKSLEAPKQLRTLEILNMDHQMFLCFESRDSGQSISVIQSTLTKSQSVCYCLKSVVSRSKRNIKIHTSILSITAPSQENLPLWTGMILMLVNAKRGVWCDYHKYQYGATNPKGQVQAAWTIISELPRSSKIPRHYCQECAIDSSKWADGTYFDLKQQIQFAQERYGLTQGALDGI